jgi:hypothetical protein
MDKNRGEGQTTGEIGKRMQLRTPLGNWTIPANELERMWPFYYSHKTDILYRSYREKWHKNGEIYCDCHTMTEHDTYSYTAKGNVKSLPEDALPTDIMDTKEGWRISGHLPMMEKETIREEEDTSMAYLRTQEEHITQYYTQIEFLSVPIKIYELLKSTNKVHIATDGGAIPLKGSIGFVIADDKGTILLTCFGQPSGNDPLSFRSEICAFLAAIPLVTLITKYYDKKLTREDESIRSKMQVYTRQPKHDKETERVQQIPNSTRAVSAHCDFLRTHGSHFCFAAEVRDTSRQGKLLKIPLKY